MKLVVAVALTILITAAQTSAQGLQPEDWYKYDRLSDVQVSADGTLLAFVVTRADESKHGNISQIWMTRTTNGSTPWQFTAGAQSSTRPRWSPDGKRLTFVTTRAGSEPQIFLIPVAGGEAIQLTKLVGGVQDYVWAPNGKKIVAASRTGKKEDKDDPLAGVVVVDDARYKADTRGYLKDQRSHLFIVDTDTGLATQITDGSGFDDSDPAWSPDGQLLAFVSDRRGRAFEKGAKTNVFIVSADGGTPRQVSDHEDSDIGPQFSPDGRYLAFSGAAKEGDQTELWLVPVDGGAATSLTDSFDERVGRFVWADTGVFFTSGMRGDSPVFSLNVKTQKVNVVAGDGSQVESFGVTPSGEIAFIKSDATHPTDLFLGRRQLTAFGEAFLRTRAISVSEAFAYKGEDGLDLQGWFMPPLGLDRSKKYPLILKIHGGPANMFSPAFDPEKQMLAARGYGVVFVNPRGSTGYGQKFVRANHLDWGGGDFRDIMTGVDTVLAKYTWLDSSRMAVYGCSYGGYMTNRIITQTTRFAAAVSECELSNLTTLYGTSDIAFWGIEDYFGGTLWEKYDLYWDRSPIKNVQRVRTPVLLIHGEADLRAPMEQAEQMFTALKRNGLETELVRYPNESHGEFINGNPAHFVDRVKRVIDWFDKHTKTERESR